MFEKIRTKTRASFKMFRAKLAVFLYNLLMPNNLSDAELGEILIRKLKYNDTYKKLVPMATRPAPDLRLEYFPDNEFIDPNAFKMDRRVNK